MTTHASETLDELLRDCIEGGDLTAFCVRAGISPYTLHRLRRGQGKRSHRGTALAIAAERGVSEDRVQRAIEASRG